MQNDAGTEVSYWHKSDTKISRNVPRAAKQNPGAAATATGAMCTATLESSQTKNTAKSRRNAMSLYSRDEHKRVARMLGYALALGSQDAWFGLRLVLRQRLTVEERVHLAFMALKALDTEDAIRTADAAIWHRFGEVAQ